MMAPPVFALKRARVPQCVFFFFIFCRWTIQPVKWFYFKLFVRYITGTQWLMACLPRRRFSDVFQSSSSCVSHRTRGCITACISLALYMRHMRPEVYCHDSCLFSSINYGYCVLDSKRFQTRMTYTQCCA